MLAIIFAIAAMVCAIGWLVYWLVSLALILYMTGQDIPLPSRDEMKACLEAVIRNLIDDMR